MQLPFLALALISVCGVSSGLARAETSGAALGKVIRADAGALGGGKPLSAGDAITSGETLETQAGSAVVLLHEGGMTAAAMLKPGTRVRWVQNVGKGLETVLERGGLLSDVHNPEKRREPYRIRTRTAVMGVRGTIFFVKEDPGKSVFLCSCHGEIGVRAVGVKPAPGTSGEQVFKGTHHDHPVLIQEQAGVEIAARVAGAPMGSDHSDADSTELEGVLGGLR